MMPALTSGWSGVVVANAVAVLIDEIVANAVAILIDEIVTVLVAGVPVAAAHPAPWLGFAFLVEPPTASLSTGRTAALVANAVAILIDRALRQRDAGEYDHGQGHGHKNTCKFEPL